MWPRDLAAAKSKEMPQHLLRPSALNSGSDRLWLCSLFQIRNHVSVQMPAVPFSLSPACSGTNRTGTGMAHWGRQTPDKDLSVRPQPLVRS